MGSTSVHPHVLYVGTFSMTWYSSVRTVPTADWYIGTN